MEETWRTIKQLLNKRSKSTIIDLLTDKGTEITTKKEISNVMKNISVLLTPLYNHNIFQIKVELSVLHLFLRRAIGHANKSTDLYLFFQLLKSYMRNLFLSTSTTICL